MVLGLWCVGIAVVAALGNNIYGEDVRRKLEELLAEGASAEGLGAYILMQRILPPINKTLMMRRAAVSLVDSLSELGVYSTFVRCAAPPLLLRLAWEPQVFSLVPSLSQLRTPPSSPLHPFYVCQTPTFPFPFSCVGPLCPPPLSPLRYPCLALSLLGPS